MTEPRNPLEPALDLLVYLPVGFAVTVAEELPKMTAKGRAKISGQITVARVVGQFAVGRARKLVEDRIGRANPPEEDAPVAAHPGGAPPDNGPAADQTFEDLLGDGDEGPNVGDPTANVAHTNGSVVTSPVVTASVLDGAESSPSADGLAIPGYDSLSASQVVQRLAGLSGDELAAVGVYEAANRARRTVLTRVSQLQGS